MEWRKHGGRPNMHYNLCAAFFPKHVVKLRLIFLAGLLCLDAASTKGSQSLHEGPHCQGRGWCWFLATCTGQMVDGGLDELHTFSILRDVVIFWPRSLFEINWPSFLRQDYNGDVQGKAAKQEECYGPLVICWWCCCFLHLHGFGHSICMYLLPLPFVFYNFSSC